MLFAIGCGKAAIEVSLLGKSCTVPVTVTPKDIKDGATIALDEGPFSYTGDEIRPTVTVKTSDGNTLKEGEDYELKYSDNVDAGEQASVTVTGIGNYTGTIKKIFEIASAKLLKEDAVFENEGTEYTYTGEEIQPAVIVTHENRDLIAEEDYQLSYKANINAGASAVAVVEGKGNYEGTIELPFSISPAELTKDGCTVAPIPDQEYAAAPITPDLSVEWKGKALVSGTDYTIKYNDNTKVGTATVTLTGIGNFSGKFDTTFEIVPASIEGGEISVDGTYTYDGAEICPETVTVKLGIVTLEKQTDYEIDSYGNNISAGNAAITVKGIGNYTGTLTGTFEINPIALDKEDCAIDDVADQVFTGAPITPAVSVSWNGNSLEQDVDFSVSYEEADNRNVGAVSAVVEAKGNYSGEIGNAEFDILPADLSDCTIDRIPEQTATGAEITPPVVVRLKDVQLEEGRDYTVEYSDNVAAGTATVTVTGGDNFKDGEPLTETFEIKEQPAAAPTPAPETPGSSATPGTPETSETSKTPETTPGTSGTPTPGTTGTPVMPEASGTPTAEPPAVGTVSVSEATSAEYRVTGSMAAGMEVEYLAPTSKNKAVVAVPDTVLINNVPCVVTSIAPNAFRNNKKLKAVMIPANVTRIGKGAFLNCAKLKKITIKSKKLTLKKIGQKAFARISRKAVIKVPSGKKKSYKKILRKRGLSASVKIK